MEIPRFELLEYLLSNVPHCKYDLAGSNLPPVDLKELGLPEDLDPSWAHVGGSPELKKLIADVSHVTEDSVLVTQGTSEANFLVGLALLPRGARVVVERPYYEPLWKALQLLGARISFLPRSPEEAYSLPLDRLDEILPEDTQLLVLTNLYNPGGTLMEAAELRDLATVAEEGGFYILMDEIFREAAFRRTPPCALTLSDRFIVTSSPSKFYGLGGLRIGWCLAAEKVLQRVSGVKVFATVAPSVLSDELAIRALRMREKIGSRNRALIEENRKLVEEWIQREKGVEWVPPVGYMAFPRFHGNVNKLSSVALERYGTLITPGRFFGADNHFRLCFGMQTEVLRAGLEGLAKAAKEV